MPNPPATESETSLRHKSPSGAKSAGFAIAVGALSAVLLALPLMLAHPLITSLWDSSGLETAFQERTMGGPRLIYWSWQHSDDLSYLDIKTSGVAYLVGRYVIDGQKLQFDRNFCAIKMPADVYRVAAVRIEMKRFDAEAIERVAEALSAKVVASALENPRRIDALQIDFDARENERKFYTLLLRKVRAKLPEKVKLSMTALASWCLGDNWLTGAHLPVDEVVPMLFSLGLGHRQVSQILARGGALKPKLFGGRLAPALSINEPKFFGLLGNLLPQYRRLYLFSSRGWDQTTYQKAQMLLSASPESTKNIYEVKQ